MKKDFWGKELGYTAGQDGSTLSGKDWTKGWDFSIAVPQAFGSFSKVRFSAHALLQVSLGVAGGQGFPVFLPTGFCPMPILIPLSPPSLLPQVLDFLLFIYCVHEDERVAQVSKQRPASRV